jgi:hypothetical protein
MELSPWFQGPVCPTSFFFKIETKSFKKGWAFLLNILESIRHTGIHVVFFVLFYNPTSFLGTLWILSFEDPSCGMVCHRFHESREAGRGGVPVWQNLVNFTFSFLRLNSVLLGNHFLISWYFGFWKEISTFELKIAEDIFEWKHFVLLR